MTENRLQRALLILAGIVFVVTPVELWLSDHTEETQQWIPFVICAAGVVIVGLALMRPGQPTLLLRAVMVVAALTSLLGMYYHVSGNVAFELEIRPNDGTMDVLFDALKGANPFLAPGILALGAMIALLATWYQALKSE